MNSWYLHRLRAMSLSEMLKHARKKANQKLDLVRRPDFNFQPSGGEIIEQSFPQMPAGAPPPELKTALARDVRQIRSGRINAFMHLDLKIDLPPRWHKDYLAGVEIENHASAFKINHRSLPEGADIKLIWELSRWYFLVRLAQGAAVLGDRDAGKECVRLLEDWAKYNPPFQGWNWTSALETGLRLIQLTWIDRLLAQAGFENELEPVMDRLLGAHAYYTWRYRSFGSSANNHLLGELAGLAVALNRWIDLTKFAAPLPTIQRIWEQEVLAQFAEDGGNREQALNYHLFSFEFCWQTRLAVQAAGLKISPEVEERLIAAGDFFRKVQIPAESWDYGDSDSAFVTPLAARDSETVREWLGWFNGQPEGAAIHYWLGEPPAPAKPRCVQKEAWSYFPVTGIAIHDGARWRGRWDLSPLGYLATAAHGHLDALHLSLWLDERAFIIDPGTGAYYADKRLREQLADWAAHNGPRFPGAEFPQRLGPFLWAKPHEQPTFDGRAAALQLPIGRVRREVQFLNDGNRIEVRDSAEGEGNSATFAVSWQFAPGVALRQLDAQSFLAEGDRWQVRIEVEGSASAELALPSGGKAEGWPETTCSPSFRQMAQSARLNLRAGGHNTCVLRTSFLISVT